MTLLGVVVTGRLCSPVDQCGFLLSCLPTTSRREEIRVLHMTLKRCVAVLATATQLLCVVQYASTHCKFSSVTSTCDMDGNSCFVRFERALC